MPDFHHPSPRACWPSACPAASAASVCRTTAAARPPSVARLQSGGRATGAPLRAAAQTAPPTCCPAGRSRTWHRRRGGMQEADGVKRRLLRPSHSKQGSACRQYASSRHLPCWRAPALLQPAQLGVSERPALLGRARPLALPLIGHPLPKCRIGCPASGHIGVAVLLRCRMCKGALRGPAVLCGCSTNQDVRHWPACHLHSSRVSTSSGTDAPTLMKASISL